jgi:hypothetical protein
VINKQRLVNWLHDQIDMEISCIEDLEITEGEENLFGRGKLAAYEQMLKEIDK